MRWALLLFLLLSSCTREPTKKPEGEAGLFRATKKVVPVTAFVVGGREVPLVVNATGKTEASDRFEAKAPSNVKVQKVFAEEGGRVNPGDPLIKFDDELMKLKLAKARAEIREAEAGLENANFLQRSKDELLEQGKLSELESEGIDEKINLYQATLDRAKAEVELYEHMGELEQINSPIAGTVTKRQVNEGSEVTEEQTLLEVVRLDPIYFVFPMPVEAVSVLEKGAEISVRFSALPGQELTGEVVSVGAEARGEGGAVDVKLKIPNPELGLKAEMRGAVVIRTEAKKKVLPILETALVRGERSNYVFKIEGGRARRVAVELGDTYNGQPTVEKGIGEGDMIVALAEEDLKDGAAVEVQATRAER